MSNMIGKVSGVDWSIAPEGAKFVDMKYRLYAKGECGGWLLGGEYYVGLNVGWGTDRYISKEEDLGLNIKVVKSFDDIEVGMFFKSVNNSVRLVTYKECGSFEAALMVDGGTYKWSVHNGVLNEKFHSWSYTYNGEYQLVQREPEETETQKQLKVLESQADELQKQIAKVKASL
jgi:hypothetical protein